MKLDAYKSSPQKILEGKGLHCPVFSDTDDYIKNYDQISADHLMVFDADGVNPFMAEDFWGESEEITANLVRRFTPQNGRLLDVGCGMGRLLAKLPNYERYGMDISAGYLEHAIKGGAEVCLSKVEDMPYHDEYFDTVVCTDVLEHVLDINASITQLFRVLKSGGHLVIRVPYRENLEPYLQPEYPYQMAHLRNFDEFGLRLLFEKIFSGSVVEDVRGPYLEHDAYFKWPIRFHGLGFMRRLGLRFCSLISPEMRRRATQRLFHPVEISIVIKKP
jgi:ubiquinone/menaquinone biosynthesis C-methylase UbiE